ncbi:MAG: hypothetical protein K6G52_06945 [Treponemataceae bacterium]|nr:hypothetical protein [Treponemataceae bacterium]
MLVKTVSKNKKGKVKEECHEVDDINKTVNTVNFLIKAGLLLWADVYNADKNELVYSVGKK